MRTLLPYEVIIGTIFIAFVFGCSGDSSNTQEIPDWVENHIGGEEPTQGLTIIDIIGVGESKAEAISSALVEIAGSVKTHSKSTMRDLGTEDKFPKIEKVSFWISRAGQLKQKYLTLVARKNIV